MEQVARVGTGIMILKDDQILLGLRTYAGARRGGEGDRTWTFPGGKVEFGETVSALSISRLRTLDLWKV